MEENKKILFSAIQPTGVLTLGNYLGAIKNWVKLQDEYKCIYSIADMHSLTVFQTAEELRKNTIELAASLLAAGVDKSTLFIQSNVSEHAELTWVLNCNTYIGEISRMTQFKEKGRKHSDNINVGLMDYPVLMAADILLYQAELVPVGADQKQHLELSRDLAARFNNKYSQTFAVPEPYITKQTARIMSLQEPGSKMSKSDPNPNGFVTLNDSPDVITAKFKRAVTDSGSEVVASKEKPGVTNLLNIYCSFTGKTIKQAEKEFEGKGYGDFKLKVAEAVVEGLKPIQERKAQLLKDKGYIESLLLKGRDEAKYIARKTLSKVYRKVGFYSL